MAYKWKPNASQKAEFKERMNNPETASEYYQTKQKREDKRRSKSSFDYRTAGGSYIPTEFQARFCIQHDDFFKTTQENQARLDVIISFDNRSKSNHDNIHIVNEKIREFNLLQKYE